MYKEVEIILALHRDPVCDELLYYFGHHGIQSYVTENEKSIFELLRSKNIQCIVMQMNLRGLDAIELTLRIRDLNFDVPIVVLNFADEFDSEFVKTVGIVTHFQYPFQIGDVVQAVFDELNRRRLSAKRSRLDKTRSLSEK